MISSSRLAKQNGQSLIESIICVSVSFLLMMGLLQLTYFLFYKQYLNYQAFFLTRRKAIENHNKSELEVTETIQQDLPFDLSMEGKCTIVK